MSYAKVSILLGMMMVLAYPINAFVWPLLSPGMGQLYDHNILTAGFILIWWIVNCYMSKLLPAIHYSALGQFVQAKNILDVHWFMNISSIYIFSIYTAYVHSVENNKLYDWEQSEFLKRQYQYEKFHMPVEYGKPRSEGMYIIAAFEYNHFLERAVTGIQIKGVSKERILAAPLDKRGEERRLFDTIHSSDGLSLLDLAAALGTLFMLFGSIYGFIWAWGSIVWGVIGLFSGFALGLIIKLIATKKYANNRSKAEKMTEVVLIIECKGNEMEMICSVLWGNHVLGIGSVAGTV